MKRTYTPNLQLWGQTLSNPIGLAAGFDKDGRAIDGTNCMPNTTVYSHRPRSLQPRIQLGGGRERHTKTTGECAQRCFAYLLRHNNIAWKPSPARISPP